MGAAEAENDKKVDATTAPCMKALNTGVLPPAARV
jgi:hypothetical protein